MKDIADRVGVSKMAVSSVLGETSSNVSVSTATRDRILDVARQLQYRPNAIARSLRSRRTNVIGLYSGYRFMDPRNPFMAEIVGGLQEGCAEHHKDLLLHSVFRGDSVDDIYSELADGRIDGLVMTAPPEDPLAERLAASHLPVVVVADAIPRLPSVIVDDAQGAGVTFDYLLARGHRRLVFRSWTERRFSAERRRAAYLACAQERGIDLREWRASQDDTLPDPYLDDWSATPVEGRPTAAICWNDISAFNLLEECTRRKIAVPEELAIAGFDGAPNRVARRFRLTTVCAPWAEVARVAVRLLIDQLEGKEVPSETILPVELVAGDSA